MIKCMLLLELQIWYSYSHSHSHPMVSIHHHNIIIGADVRQWVSSFAVPMPNQHRTCAMNMEEIINNNGLLTHFVHDFEIEELIQLKEFIFIVMSAFLNVTVVTHFLFSIHS